MAAKSIAADKLEAWARARGRKFGRLADGSLMVEVTCGRCGGLGHYSQCEAHGTRCFACNVASGGERIGWRWESAAKVYRREQREAARLRRLEREAIRREHALAVERARFCAMLARPAVAFVSMEQVIEWTNEARRERERAEKAAEAARAAAARVFLGAVGEKLEIRARVVKMLRGGMPWERKWRLTVLDTPAGARAIVWAWIAGEGEEVVLRGTVKAHEVSRIDRLPQTVLTRVEIVGEE